MVKVIRRWLGLEALETRVSTLEGVVEGLRAEVHTLGGKPEGTPADVRRFRWLHRLNEALRGEEVI